MRWPPRTALSPSFCLVLPMMLPWLVMLALFLSGAQASEAASSREEHEGACEETALVQLKDSPVLGSERELRMMASAESALANVAEQTRANAISGQLPVCEDLGFSRGCEGICAVTPPPSWSNGRANDPNFWCMPGRCRCLFLWTDGMAGGADEADPATPCMCANDRPKP